MGVNSDTIGVNSDTMGSSETSSAADSPSCRTWGDFRHNGFISEFCHRENADISIIIIITIINKKKNVDAVCTFFFKGKKKVFKKGF
jgi:hypothetical protein